MKLLVFDIGGTETKYSVMDDKEAVYASGIVATPMESLSALLDTLHEIYQGYQAQVEGIAVSMPGIIDADAGYCHTGGMLEYNQDQPFAALLSHRCGCPVHIDNDGKCAALAECASGSLKGCKNGAVFLIGSGVGGGLVLNGQLLRGAHFSAGEFSYLSLNFCQWDQLTSMVGHTCATTGLLAMLREAKHLPPDAPLNGKDAFAMMDAGDEVALRVLKEFTKGIAFTIYNLQMVLDLEYVAIGGGISKQDRLLQSIHDSFTELLEQAYPPLRALVKQTVKIVRCRYGNEANQIGALQSYLQWQGKEKAV